MTWSRRPPFMMVTPFLAVSFSCGGCAPSLTGSSAEPYHVRPVSSSGHVTPTRPIGGATTALATASTDPAMPPQGVMPLSGLPQFILINPQETAITPYRAYLVDVLGARPPLQLWPHRSDCPKDKQSPKRTAVAGNGGSIQLPAPTRGFPLGECVAGPLLPAGHYLLRIESGYGRDLYAFSPFTLPLDKPVALQFDNHYDVPNPCTPAKAKRAANLVLRQLRASKELPANTFDGCQVKRARCGPTASETPVPPPDHCTITLHDTLLRINLPVTSDSPRTVTAWLDREAVYSRTPDISATSASRIMLAGKPAFVIANDSRHIHEHGGDAAKIGHVTLTIINPLQKPLSLQVSGVEYLGDSSCELPKRVVATPKVASVSSHSAAPGRSEVTIGFAPQAAYQAHCDRFATRVTLTVDGVSTKVTSEHHVTREEPYRP